MSGRVTAAHADWLALTEPAGPFLTLPVLRRVWPDGLDRTPAAARAELRERVEELGGGDGERRQFVDWVLRRLLAFGPRLREGTGVPDTLTVSFAEHVAVLRPDFAVVGPEEPDRPDGRVRLLVSVWPAGTDFAAHVAGEHWAASPIDRMAAHCRSVGVELGLVTDGDRFTLVWAPRSGPIGRATWTATVFAEAAERALLDSFVSVLGAKRFFAVAADDQLEALLAESAAAQAEVTGQLGFQVRRAVELLVSAFSRGNRGRGGELLAGVDPHHVYEAACTVMMRLVFLLYAEERRLLPLGDELYDRSYAVSPLRQLLRDAADTIGNEETLEHRHTAWPRLLATFRAVYAGIAHDELRIPAYGGRLFDPDRFPFLEGRRPGESWRAHPSAPLPVDDRTILGVLTAVQILEMREAGVVEARRLSFRSLDVEQIGHVYEGLLDHGARRIDATAVGLVGRPGSEPEVALAELEAHAGRGDDHLAGWLAEVTGRSVKQVRALLAKPADDLRLRRLRVACDNDAALTERLKPFVWLLRDDLRDLPTVYLAGSVYVTEVSHRRDSGTEYTTKELADEVVRYALEPLVYSPGPAEGADPADWKLKSSAELLALRVCDPAVGSGAILTAACRFLGDRLVEAWAAEGRAPTVVGSGPADDVDDVVVEARRAVAERCLYGVDRDEMAVEMAKLSLWLTTMAKERPFSFLDHALRAGDSLLGITSIEQVTSFHIDLAAVQAPINFAGDLEPVVKEALELRRRLETAPVVSVRDVEEKSRLLARADELMRVVRLAADLVVGAALSTAGNSKNDMNARLVMASSALRHALDTIDVDDRQAQLDRLEGIAAGWLNERRPPAAPVRRPLHWPLAFPEVFLDGEHGFDVIVGNPPFLHGQKLTGRMGTDLRELAVRYIAENRRGSADLVAYFFLRASTVLNPKGYAGLLATNTIAQGDTREVALDAMTDDGWRIYRAVKSVQWPAVALGAARTVAARLRAGIDVVAGDPDAAEAFRFANEAMWQQRIRSEAAARRPADDADYDVDAAVAALDVPANRSWRPFQLAFVLINIPALTDPTHVERSADGGLVDLLFFPTGGGKTEAYLGLTAFTLAIRRLQGTVAGHDGDGLAVLMRYTLRLLTAQQFQRAAALICACEVLRRRRYTTDSRWGATPFRLGMWVGGSLTPNRGRQAQAVLEDTRDGKRARGAQPVQLTSCPWCGRGIDPASDARYDPDRWRTLVFCGDPLGGCAFTELASGGEGLPVVTVDEELYRLLPALIISTADKWAQLPLKGPLHLLFGRVSARCERHGYRSADLDKVGDREEADSHRKTRALPAAKTRACNPLRPPDLIIQDELHLISGPLGTLVGLYETAIDELASWEVDGVRVRPKVVASTATVRRARQQVHALFWRDLAVFPPPVLDVEDNFFARQRPTTDKPGRRYLGICAMGQRVASVETRVFTTVLAAAQKLYDTYGAAADPWMTLVGYFSSLRELGGAKRLIDDDVKSRLRNAARRGLARRTAVVVRELTSRIGSGEIGGVLDELNTPFDPNAGDGAARPVDVLLATNMISVGVDVSRLGLMVTVGQPKATAEYIQATSRVGRHRDGPGLVLTIYNWARPRDLSHYETFEHYHDTFYRHVEALSVTPFSARALDRGLTAVLVAMVRQQHGPVAAWNPQTGAHHVPVGGHPIIARVAEILAARAEQVTARAETAELVRQSVQARLDEWAVRQRKAGAGGAILGYDEAPGAVVALLEKPTLGDWPMWAVPNSLRETEPNVNLIVDVNDWSLDRAGDWKLGAGSAVAPPTTTVEDTRDDTDALGEEPAS